MTADGDILEISGRRVIGQGDESRHTTVPRKFLSVWFRCCHVYGRMKRNADESCYEGRCPKCGAPVRASIGESGTNRRVFEAR